MTTSPLAARENSHMHWLDRLATTVIRQPRLYPRLFPDGWGRLERLDELLARIEAADHDVSMPSNRSSKETDMAAIRLDDSCRLQMFLMMRLE